MTGNFYSVAVSPDCCLCLCLTLTLTGVTQCPSQPRPGPTQLILNRISSPSTRGCHQTNSDYGAMCSAKYASVHYRPTQIISRWRHGRALATGIYWAVMREIEARVSVLRQGPSGSQFPDNVKIMSGKTAPAADFPLINYPTSGSR